jgi:hypothetical protein
MMKGLALCCKNSATSSIWIFDFTNTSGGRGGEGGQRLCILYIIYEIIAERKTSRRWDKGDLCLFET